MAIVDSSSSSSSRDFDSSSSPSDIADCPPTKHTEDQSPHLGKNPNSDQNSKSEDDENQKKKPNYEDGTNLDRGFEAEIPNVFVTENRIESVPNSDFVSETQNYGSGTSSTGSSSSEGGHENENETTENGTENGFHNHSHHHHHHHHHAPTMQELVDFFSKLNPHAKEFIPPLSHANSEGISPENANKANNNRKKKNGYGTKKRSANNRLHRAQWDDSIRRTVYVSDIDHQVTEEQLAALFLSCGQVVDCRVCGDPNSVLRFAFVEFTDEDGARRALSLAGTMLGFYPVRVLPSKTAIIPVNPTFLPQSEDEREMCARTIYCTNIDKKISQAEVKLYFESACGKVARLRLLGDHRHSTRIAFVEFVMAESAIGALNCSGVLLGTLPIRVSPSKTPVRSCMARPFFM